MDEVCMAAITNKPLVSDDKPMKNITGEMPATATAGAGSGSFDCSICLDFAADPVVTLCGHLYCWPCIYEWLRPTVGSASTDNRTAARQQCPVCKAALSADSLVPLYGRGGSPKKSLDGMAIPRRPTVHRENVVHQHTQSAVDDRHHHNMEPSPPLRPLRHAHHHSAATEFDFVYPPSPMGRGLIHSTAGGVLGGMAEAVLPWAFGGQVPPSMLYTSPYSVVDHTVGPRLRRQQMEVERSLHQIWFFLFVFVVLCLLLF